MTETAFFGLAVHSQTIAVARLAPFSMEPVVTEIPNDPAVIRKTFQRFVREAGDIRCCYEAGPCGHVLQRQLAGLKIQCDVIAPSLIPKKRAAAASRRPATVTCAELS